MDDPISRLQEFLDKALKDKSQLRILEAGCGSASHVNFKQPVHMTGIDISEQQLQRNTALDEKILGDLQRHRFQPSSFDVIICWTVLEHLDKPELALDKFTSAIKPGGIIILGLPNLLSMKGVITKYTPHWFHVWAYRYLLGREDAGKNDVGPFKTYLKFNVAPNAIKAFATRNSLTTTYFEIYDVVETDFFSRKNTFTQTTYTWLNGFVKLASFGKLDDSEFVIVLQK